MSSEQESRLYFGAQRGARSSTQSFSKLSTDHGNQELIDLGIPLESSRRDESYEERKRQINMEIRQRELELEELNVLHGERSILRPHTSSSALTTEQLQEVVQLIQAFQPTGGCVATDRAREQRLIDTAPRFNLSDPKASLDAFDIFFDVNRVSNDQLKFSVLNGRLTIETMQQFGRENPNSGGDLIKLKKFLMAYTREFSPCMNHYKSLDKYGQNSLLRDVFHEAKLMADLDRDERIKLNAFFLTSGHNKKIIENHLHLPVENLVSKVRQKWNTEIKSNLSSPARYSKSNSSPRPYREYRNLSRSPPKMERREASGDLCFYHERFGDRAYRCQGGDCRFTKNEAYQNKMRGQHPRRLTWADRQPQQGNDLSNLAQGN